MSVGRFVPDAWHRFQGELFPALAGSARRRDSANQHAARPADVPQCSQWKANARKDGCQMPLGKVVTPSPNAYE